MPFCTFISDFPPIVKPQTKERNVLLCSLLPTGIRVYLL